MNIYFHHLQTMENFDVLPSNESNAAILKNEIIDSEPAHLSWTDLLREAEVNKILLCHFRRHD